MKRLILICALLAAAGGAAGASELKSFDARSLERIRAANPGRPFVLAFWSLHCAPCKEDFVLLKELQAKQPALAIVLVSTYPPAEREAVTRFLATQDLGRIERWTFADEFEERIRFSVDRAWRGELPRTYLFDAAHQPTAFSGVLEQKTVDAWLARVTKKR